MKEEKKNLRTFKSDGLEGKKLKPLLKGREQKILNGTSLIRDTSDGSPVKNFWFPELVTPQAGYGGRSSLSSRKHQALALRLKLARGGSFMKKHLH